MTTLRETFEEHGYDGGWRCSCGWTGSYDEHAAHLEAVVLAWVGARLAEAREAVAETAWRAAANFGEARDEGPRGYVFDYQAEWVIAALCDALGVPVAPNSEPVDPNPTSALAAELDRSNDTDGIQCEACPFAGCRGCEAEAARRANGEAK